MMSKKIVRQLCPPIVWDSLSSIKGNILRGKSSLNNPSPQNIETNPGHQDLDVYWNPQMAEILETWGEDHVWKEIQFLMTNCQGKVLDIACGTGKTMEILSKFSAIQLFGCDISDLLIQKATERGISQEFLKVCDATKTDYEDDYFDYSYSIGSLEHFTEEGISQFISECYRTTRNKSFHMIPVSRSGKDEGWIKTFQSFYNNSIDWWLNKYTASYEKVLVLDSNWNDNISVGKWFVCTRNEDI